MSKKRRRYEGLHKDKDAPRFQHLVPQTPIRFTIENTVYRARPYMLYFWSEFNGELAPSVKFMMTKDDLEMLYQVVTNKYEEMKNASKKED